MDNGRRCRRVMALRRSVIRRRARMLLPIEVSHARQDQRPGELDRGSGIVAGGADRDTKIVRGLRIDGGVAGSSRGDQLEPRQLPRDILCERSAFAHDADYVETAQPLNHCRGIGDLVVERADLRPPPHRRPVDKLQRHVLVIVQNRNPYDILPDEILSSTRRSRPARRPRLRDRFPSEYGRRT